jgi:uncharacterized protein
LFEWDQANAEHIFEHGILPREAEQAIDDPHALAFPAKDVAGEPRFGLVGESEAGRLLCVIYTWRGNQRRVVTAYPANRQQQRIYDERRP